MKKARKEGKVKLSNENVAQAVAIIMLQKQHRIALSRLRHQTDKLELKIRSVVELTLEMMPPETHDASKINVEYIVKQVKEKVLDQMPIVTVYKNR